MVGITGGIGSGKSLICKIFAVLCAPVYEADARAKWLMDNNAEVKAAIEALFGVAAYDSDKLNRQYLADHVFHDKTKLEQLNGIVHPAVHKDFNQWCGQHKYPFVIKEAALLVETGSYQSLDALIVVTAPEELRIKRVLQRDPQRSEKEIRGIMDKQLPPEETTSHADFIISNDEQQLITPQVIQLHEAFMHKKRAMPNGNALEG